MTARFRREDIKYISRLKFGNQSGYSLAHHTPGHIYVNNS